MTKFYTYKRINGTNNLFLDRYFTCREVDEVEHM